MDLSATISFIKENYPNNADEIYECLSLLIDTLDSTLVSIQNSSADAFAKRDFFRIKAYADMADEINKIQKTIKEYMEKMRIITAEDTLSDSEEEPKDDELKEADQPAENVLAAENQEFDIPIENDDEDYRVDSTVRHTLSEDFQFKKPAAFEMESTRIEIKDWRELYFFTCAMLYRKDKTIFESFIDDSSMNGRTIKYFSRTRKGMSYAKRIPGSDIYVSSQFGANATRNMIIRMLRKYKMDIGKYYVYFSEDYSRLINK